MKSVINDLIVEIGNSGAVAMGTPRIIELLTGKLQEEKKMCDAEHNNALNAVLGVMTPDVQVVYIETIEKMKRPL